MIVVLAGAAAPASASLKSTYYYVVPMTDADTGQIADQQFGATCGNTIEGQWYTLYLHTTGTVAVRLPFEMPAAGPFQAGQHYEKYEGTRTGDQIRLEWKNSDGKLLRYGTGTIRKGRLGYGNIFEPDICGKPRFSEEDIRRMNTYAGDANYIAVLGGSVAGVCATALLTAKPVCPQLIMPGIVVAVGGGTVGWVLTRLANDPPDQRFRELVTPAKLRPRRMRARGRLSPQRARAVNALFETYAKSTSLHRALVVSIERAQGAIAFGGPADDVWERQQMSAAVGHARALAEILDRLPSQSTAAVRALKAAGIRLQITTKAARRAQETIKRRGLPRELMREARDMVMSQEEIESLRQEITRAKPRALAGGFPDVIASPRLRDAFRTEAGLLREFAARVERDPVAPAS